MNLESRFTSGLIVLASIGSILYLGAMDYLIFRAVWYGSATLAWDYLEPVEAVLVMPFVILMMLIVLFREVKRLTG